MEGRGSLCTPSREVDSCAQLCLCDAGARVTLSSPNFSVCTCEWREYLPKEISGRRKHRKSTTKNRGSRGGQEGTRAHPGVSAASPSRTTCPPLLLCPPTALLSGFFSSTCSSNARASSGAPGRGRSLLSSSSSSALSQHAVTSPAHPSLAVGLSPRDQSQSMNCEQQLCLSLPEAHRSASSGPSFSCCGDLRSCTLRW